MFYRLGVLIEKGLTIGSPIATLLGYMIEGGCIFPSSVLLLLL